MNCIIIVSLYSLVVTVRADQRSNGRQEETRTPFTFSYYSNENADNHLNIIAILKNQSPNMVYTVYETGINKKKENITNKIESKNTTEQGFRLINHKIKHEFIFISIYVTIKTNDGCSKNVTILEGQAYFSYNDKPANERKWDCLLRDPCIIEVDVLHECTEGAHQQPTSMQPTANRYVLTYVIPSVIAVCVITLMIYIGVKKYCRQHSQPVEALELNTYATTTDLVYADLNLMHGESNSPRDGEESTYAQIIGVLTPVDKNVRSK